MIKNICNKPTANIVLNCVKLKSFLLRSHKRQRCPLSPLLFNILLEVLDNAVVRLKKRGNTGKERIMVLFTSEITIVHIKNMKELTKESRN